MWLCFGGGLISIYGEQRGSIIVSNLLGLENGN